MVKEDRKRILFVISTLNTGGAQRALANMSMGFPQEWECDFLLNDAQDIIYPYRGNIIDLGMKPCKDKTGLVYQCKAFVKRFFKLRRLKKSGNYIACISALTSANAVNIISGNKYCKTIISIRAFMSKAVGDAKGIKSKIKIWSIKVLANYADYVIAVSKKIAEDLVNNFKVQKKKIVTIYNGYNLENIEELSKEELTYKERTLFNEDGKIIVSVGRLSAEKGQEHLIYAFKGVSAEVDNVKLIILGEGSSRKKLEHLIMALHLEEKVILCGFIENPYKVIRHSDLFVLSSLYEGFPNALAESLCIGTPTVSTDCDSGAREILAPNTPLTQKVITGFEKAEYGVLCPVCKSEKRDSVEMLTSEEQDMADAIIQLLRDKQLYEHYKTLCRVRAKQLSMPIVIEQWISLLKK